MKYAKMSICWLWYTLIYMKMRLDIALVERKIVPSRSQAESWIRLGKVLVNGAVARKSGQMVADSDGIHLTASEQYVSRAGLKLASVAQKLKLEFKNSIVLDVGSSTGGFTDYALQHGAKKVVAVDVGTDQLHPSLRSDKRIELHEKTDIRSVSGPKQPLLPSSSGGVTRLTSLEYESGEDRAALGLYPHSEEVAEAASAGVTMQECPDIVVMDVSFISLREILPHIASLCGPKTQVVAMLKPQFEAGKHQVNKGVIKNDSIRRQIIKEFELWVRQYFTIIDKSDSEVVGGKGNRERFYLLKHKL